MKYSILGSNESSRRRDHNVSAVLIVFHEPVILCRVNMVCMEIYWPNAIKHLIHVVVNPPNKFG